MEERCVDLNRRIPDGLRTGLIHGDVFYDNVLFERGKFKALIDFEEGCHYYQAFDIGMGIVGLCTGETTVEMDKARALVAGYESIRLLEEIERVSLQLLVEYAAIATSYWRFWKYHIHTPIREYADKHWQMVRVAQGMSVVPANRFVATVFRDSVERGGTS